MKDRLHFKCTAKQGGVSLEKIMGRLSDDGKVIFLKTLGKIANEDFVYERPGFKCAGAEISSSGMTEDDRLSIAMLNPTPRALAELLDEGDEPQKGTFIRFEYSEDEVERLKKGLAEIIDMGFSIDDKSTDSWTFTKFTSGYCMPGDGYCYLQYLGIGIQPNGKVGPLDLYGKSFDEYLEEFGPLHNRWCGCPDADCPKASV